MPQRFFRAYRPRSRNEGKDWSLWVDICSPMPSYIQKARRPEGQREELENYTGGGKATAFIAQEPSIDTGRNLKRSATPHFLECCYCGKPLFHPQSLRQQ